MAKTKYKIIMDAFEEVYTTPKKVIKFLNELHKYNPDSNIYAEEIALYETNDKDQFCPVLYASVKEVITYLQTLK